MSFSDFLESLLTINSQIAVYFGQVEKGESRESGESGENSLGQGKIGQVLVWVCVSVVCERSLVYVRV